MSLLRERFPQVQTRDASRPLSGTCASSSRMPNSPSCARQPGSVSKGIGVPSGRRSLASPAVAGSPVRLRHRAGGWAGSGVLHDHHVGKESRLRPLPRLRSRARGRRLRDSRRGPGLRELSRGHLDDLSRSGSFSARQRELYEAALVVRETGLANYRPGVTFKQVGEKIAAMLKAKGLEPMRTISPASSAMAATTTRSAWRPTT